MGLFAAKILELLEGSGPAIGTKFDLIAGTSVGGLLALGLASGRRASEIRNAIETSGPAIFDAGGSLTRRFHRLIRAPFASSPLQGAIKSIVGDIPFGQLVRPA
jgi:uncharacterized protein